MIFPANFPPQNYQFALTGLASFPGLPRLQFLIACSMQKYDKQSKTGGGEGLGTRLDRTPITEVETLKYLGVTISSDFSWSAHINSTCTKARKQAFYIESSTKQIWCHIIAYLYKATVLPLLDHGVGPIPLIKPFKP